MQQPEPNQYQNKIQAVLESITPRDPQEALVILYTTPSLPSSWEYSLCEGLRNPLTYSPVVSGMISWWDWGRMWVLKSSTAAESSLQFEQNTTTCTKTPAHVTAQITPQIWPLMCLCFWACRQASAAPKKSIRLIKDNQYPMGSSKTAKNAASFVFLLFLGKLWLTRKADFPLACIQQ